MSKFTCACIISIILILTSFHLYGQNKMEPNLKEADAIIRIQGLPTRFEPNPRQVKVYLFYPGKDSTSINKETGIIFSLHNWGGTRFSGTPNPKLLARLYNVVGISPDYYQSGQKRDLPYDHGLFQAMDVIRTLYEILKRFENSGNPLNKSRIYVTGGSGGGNVSLMANKLAPATFAGVIDISGMTRLSNDVAYNLPGGSKLNALYVNNPDSCFFLPAHEQEIRDLSDIRHLNYMYTMGNRAKIIVIHGESDSSCLASEAREMVKNMRLARLNVEANFITNDDVDGALILDDEHSIGDRTEVFLYFADQFLRSQLHQNSPVRLDFDYKAKVEHRVTGGCWVVDYEAEPRLEFIPD